MTRLHDAHASLRATLIASTLARAACEIRHGHFTQALSRLISALDQIDAAVDHLPSEVLARASRLAEALTVIAGEREAEGARR